MTAITRATKLSPIVDLCLDNLNLSIIPDTIASRIDMALVIAANRTMAKNSEPIILPIGPIAMKILGKDTNISEGPVDIPSGPINT